MAKNLKIDMEEIAYLEDGELFHFMTRRFDRKQTVKHHMHSLAGMTHVYYNLPGAYSYEAWLRLIQELRLSLRAPTHRPRPSKHGYSPHQMERSLA